MRTFCCKRHADIAHHFGLESQSRAGDLILADFEQWKHVIAGFVCRGCAQVSGSQARDLDGRGRNHRAGRIRDQPEDLGGNGLSRQTDGKNAKRENSRPAELPAHRNTPVENVGKGNLQPTARKVNEAMCNTKPCGAQWRTMPRNPYFGTSTSLAESIRCWPMRRRTPFPGVTE